MKRIKIAIGVLALLCGICAVYFVLAHEKTLVVHPKGLIARSELDVIATHYLLMLIVVVPTLIALFIVAWKYQAKKTRDDYDPEKTSGAWEEAILWILPVLVIAPMTFMTWKSTHRLDPYRPLTNGQSDVSPLQIQVVALDWKWLFIYPEQGIATINFVQFPDRTPIHFKLSADGSPMNSFWIPQLSGQIYAMTGMETPLYLMADGPGIYSGRAAEINGEGFADMTFVVRSSSLADFDAWVAEVKRSPLQLTEKVYNELVQPSKKLPQAFYSAFDSGLFNRIVMKPMHP